MRWAPRARGGRDCHEQTEMPSFTLKSLHLGPPPPAPRPVSSPGCNQPRRQPCGSVFCSDAWILCRLETWEGARGGQTSLSQERWCWMGLSEAREGAAAAGGRPRGPPASPARREGLRLAQNGWGRAEAHMEAQVVGPDVRGSVTPGQPVSGSGCVVVSGPEGRTE